jgi:geranylgeranyl pyrophosphate synthase
MSRGQGAPHESLLGGEDLPLSAVEEALRQAISSEVETLREAALHTVQSGGKRIRPRLLLLAFQAVGGQDISLAIPVAAAVELLHTASLVHDDINDRSNLRRGQPTVNIQWGDSLALITGDFIFVKMLQLVAGCDPAVIRLLAKCCVDVVEGEARQSLSLGDTSLTEEAYLHIIAQKTASLFAASAELGGLVARGGQPQLGALREYGRCLGIAFQIRDDTLDLVGDARTLGKPVGSDLAEGKMSLATIYARTQIPGLAGRLFTQNVRETAQLLNDCGAIQQAISRAQEYVVRARQALMALPDSEARQRLGRLADSLLAQLH